MNKLLAQAWVKPLLLVLCLLPAVWLVGAGLLDRLGANPAEALIRGLGDWTLRFLCLVLLVTPLRQHTGWVVLARWRRMLGLFVFFYASLHLLAYAWLDMGFELAELLPDIVKRPFITVGMLAWGLLLALAATSFNRAIKAMGARRWQRLHRAVYAVAVLGVLHFFWMRAGKQLFGEVAAYAAILGALLGWRIWWRVRGRVPV
jgi:sulfoxide reductase heme-binding subunit YedZ